MRNFFCLLMGFGILFMAICISIVNPENSIIDHPVFFIKYAAYILMVNGAILMFCLPWLYKKGIISPDHNNESEIVKAKANFATLTIMLPGFISIYSAIFSSLNVKTPIKWVMLIAFIYVYIKSIYLLYFKNKGD